MLPLPLRLLQLPKAKGRRSEPITDAEARGPFGGSPRHSLESVSLV